MKDEKVFFIGDVALDEYYEAPYFPTIRDKVIVQTLKPEMGGMIANAACVFSCYGGKAGFIAALNTGFISKKLCDNLNDLGIDTQYIAWDDNLPDSKTIIILAENEHTVFIPTMNLQRLELSDQAFKALLEGSYIYSNICELRPLRHKEQNLADILSILKQSNVELWCDIDVADISSSDDYLFHYIDTVFMNDVGMKRLEQHFNKDIPEVLFAYGVNQIIVTEAKNGCSVFKKYGDSFRIDGIKVKVRDVTGAGDTFCSSYLYAYIKTKNSRISAEFANYAAARSVTGKGARYGSTGVKDVIDFIRSNHGNVVRFECLLDRDHTQ
jgi:ribokinase